MPAHRSGSKQHVMTHRCEKRELLGKYGQLVLGRDTRKCGTTICGCTAEFLSNVTSTVTCQSYSYVNESTIQRQRFLYFSLRIDDGAPADYQ
ncbi:hypothetical protein STEG23_005723, partial [Scotinomys teguina]